MNWLNDLLQNDPDPTETREWIESLKAVIDHDGTERAHQLLEGMVELTRRAGAHLPFSPTTEYVNTIPAELEPQMPGDSNDGMAHPLDHPLERDGDGRARQPQARRPRRPHRVASRPAPRCTTSASTISGARRPPNIPGDLLYIQGHSSPGIYARSLPRRPHHRIAARPLPHGSRRPRRQLVSASVADARLLADADRVDGPGPDRRDLPGAQLEVPRRPRPDAEDRPQGLVLPRRRRNRRARIARRDLRRRPRRPRQPGVRRQLQPAAPRRPGARQRQDHPGAGRQLPRRRLERHQDHLGQLLGSAARARHHRQAAPADDGNRRRRIPELQGLRRQVHARAISSASIRRPPRSSPTCPTTTSGASTAAATIRTRSTPPTTRR